MEACKRCNGTGRITFHQFSVMNGKPVITQAGWKTCPNCAGLGYGEPRSEG